METRELLKEAVKVEVVKLMAQELLKEDSFEKMKSELAAEIFSSAENKADSASVPGPTEPIESTEPAKTTRIRELNSEWGYDPINKSEEKVKYLLGFLPNMKDIGRGFKGQEITEEEYEFMLNSSFTKKAIIKELEEKIKDLKKGIKEDYYEKDEFDNFSKRLNERELKSERFNTHQAASEKLEDFKSKLYGSPIAAGTPDEAVKKLKQTELDKLRESSSKSAIDAYKDVHVPEIENATELVTSITPEPSVNSGEKPKKKRAPRKSTRKKK